MELDLGDLRAGFRRISEGRHSRHDVVDRIRPGLFQYDYLALNALVLDIEALISIVPPRRDNPAVALDIGCGKSPYRALIEARGFELKTLDISADSAPDFVGTVENIGLADACTDLVLCTQVLEHSLDPNRGMREIYRILKPGGHVIASAPHVWFFHPHPTDNWRFTQEGFVRLAEAAKFMPVKLVAQGGSVLSFFQICNFLVYGAVGKLGAPFYTMSNICGKIGDKVLPNDLFCQNFALLAKKPPVGWP